MMSVNFTVGDTFPNNSFNMSNTLDNIIQHKKLSIQKQRNLLSLNDLKKQVSQISPDTSQISFKDSLLSAQPSIIAEIKRISPSKGPLLPDLDPTEIAQIYTENGAKALSILTEETFFGGSVYDLQTAKRSTHLPVLRKDFIINEYQIWESKIIGAQCILLIAAALSSKELAYFSDIAQKLDLDVLFEVHNEEEIEKILPLKPKIVGVNNRNLKTFEVNISTSISIISKYRNTDHIQLWVSESGIKSNEDIQSLCKQGFQSFLIGESILTHPNPASKLQSLLGHRCL